jgi:DNA-directed RNA polymerase specialized sigma24 family protein
MGSVIDGQDVVQDTLVLAFVALQDLEEAPPLRPSCSGLFITARSTCYAAARCACPNRSRRRRGSADSAQPDPLEMLMRKDAVKTAVSRFGELPTLSAVSSS